MRAEDRLKYLINTAVLEGFVSISEAAEHLNVSIETVRRDINFLCGENKLHKVRGGACPVKLSLRRDADYMLRKSKNQQEKIAIGREAARLIRDETVVMLDCGVSIQTVAASITGVKGVTFITNSVPVMSILLDKFSSEEITGRGILIGGEIDTQNRFTKGAFAVETLDHYYADLAFVSCTAISAESVSSYSLDECSFSSHIMRRTSASVLIAESEKLGKNSVYSFAKITDFSRIITDAKNHFPEDILAVMENSNTRLTIAN